MDNAWKPLYDWINFPKSVTRRRERTQKLTTFGKGDTRFHTVVAKCLWKLANSPHYPWGRAALTPSVYSAIPMHLKVGGVCAEYTEGVQVFFFRNLSVMAPMRTAFMTPIYVSPGLGLRMLRAETVGVFPRHVHQRLPR